MRSYKDVLTSPGDLIRGKGFIKAQTFFQQAIQKDPSFALAYVGLADSYVYLGSQRWVLPQAMGRKAEAEKILRDLLPESKKDYVFPYMIATIYAGLGDKVRAFEFLEKAYQEKSPDIPYFLKADLRVDALRSDPGFQDLMRRVGLAQ
jgi:tetratricopeptide (TPR) repeat protein